MTAAPPALCRRTAALTVAAMAAVVVVLATWLVRDAIGAGPGPVDRFPQLIQLSMLMLVVGWCIAGPVCLMIGLPLWHFAIRSDRQHHRDALRFGLIAGGFIGAVMAIIGDPGAHWYDEPLDFLGYCLAGLCAGSIAYRLGYSG